VGDHDPSRVDAVTGERVEREPPGSLLGVRVNHHRGAGLHRGDRDRLEDSRHVTGEPVPLDGALQERRLHAGVVDSFEDLAGEQVRDRLDAAIREEVRELQERVHAGRDDDVEVSRLRHPPDPRDVPAEPGSRRIDDRPEPGIAHAR
jgi:hypothetical protein